MMGVRKRAFRGVFIGENAHRSRSPCLHLQGKWSIDRRSQRTAISYPLMMPLACNLVSLFGWSKGRSESRWGEIRVTAVRITWAYALRRSEAAPAFPLRKASEASAHGRLAAPGTPAVLLGNVRGQAVRPVVSGLPRSRFANQPLRDEMRRHKLCLQ